MTKHAFYLYFIFLWDKEEQTLLLDLLLAFVALLYSGNTCDATVIEGAPRRMTILLMFLCLLLINISKSHIGIFKALQIARSRHHFYHFYYTNTPKHSQISQSCTVRYVHEQYRVNATGPIM